jgi:hypothetical protein
MDKREDFSAAVEPEIEIACTIVTQPSCLLPLTCFLKRANKKLAFA